MLYNLDKHDSKEIANYLMGKFKISIIPDRFDYSVETINKDSSIKNVETTTINYLLYKLNSADGIIPEDVNIFQAASLKADLLDNEIILSEDVPVEEEPVIEEGIQKESIPEPEVAPIIKEPIEVKAVEGEPVVRPEATPVIEGPAQEIVEEVHIAEAETTFVGEEPSLEPEPAHVDVVEEPVEGEVEPKKPKNPFSRIVTWFTQKPDSNDSISIEATDVKGKDNKKELSDN